MDFGDNYRIIEIRVTESSLDRMYYGGANLDNIGPAYNAECELLNEFKNTIRTIK